MANKGFWQSFFSRRMLVIFTMGFSSGLPFIMIGNTLKTWMARENIAVSTITFFGITGVFYSWKFLWAPLLDRFSLSEKFGRRRSWMLLTQVLIMSLMFAVGTLHPGESLYLMGILCACIGFLSATQDIAIDAYRREYLTDEELGLGSSMVQYGFRTAMLLGAGLGIWMVSPETLNLSWNQLYFLMAFFMSVGILTTLIVPEPESSRTSPVRSLREAVIEPFHEFLKRDGAYFVLAFVFLFKLGDAMSGATLNPYYVHIGFSNEQIGLIAKTYGLVAALVGLFIGGAAIFYLGIYRCLWIFGIFQGISTALFAMLTVTGPQSWALAVVVPFEDLTSGMGSAAFIAFISKICNRRYTATQFALLSSLATSGRNIFAVFSGKLVESWGWANFYYFCALLAVPGILMLIKMRRYQEE